MTHALGVQEPASDLWRIEIRRRHVVVLDRHRFEMARIDRKHPAMPALEAWHAKRWGDLSTRDAFDAEGRELMAFIAGATAMDKRNKRRKS